jgi:hypothetical protein
MRGRLAVRRRRLLVACKGDRDQVRAIEGMLGAQEQARRHRKRQLKRWRAA